MLLMVPGRCKDVVYMHSYCTDYTAVHLILQYEILSRYAISPQTLLHLSVIGVTVVLLRHLVV